MSDTDNITKQHSIDSTISSVQVEDPILEVRNASVSFDMERGESKVLDQVSLDVQRDEILGIVGESGSGKSMFASALLDAIVEPGVLSGEIRYNPPEKESMNILNISSERRRQLRWEEISMVFQGAQSSFNPTITIKDHFEETISAHNYNMEQAMDHARELLSQLYLEPDRILNSYPHELSGGMQQRTLIALSLVLEPNVLVMDEPTAALDLLMQRSILSLLEKLQDLYDLTVVFITHDLPLVAGLADRLAVLYAFEFVEVGPANDIVQNAAHPYTRALLKAVPNLDTSLRGMKPIEGKAPDPVDVPTGCSYHPRCPLADETCRSQDPGYFEASPDHQVACFHWEESSNEIPLSTTNDLEGGSEVVGGNQSEKAIVDLDNINVHFEQAANSGIFNLFSDYNTIRAVDGIDLDIYENDVVALVGESGCGKTTLGKTIIGAQRPTEGTVSYREQDIWEAKDGRDQSDIPYKEIRRSLQMIHQDPGSSLNPNRKVQSSLEAPLKKWEPQLDPDDRQERILSLLEYVGMSPPADYAQRYPHQLSGGEKQRVALIRALLMNPDLILADEAVSALDVSLRVEVMDLMLDLQNLFGTSFVFISHNLSNARYLAGKAGGRIGVMYLGEIVEIGPAEEVIKNPKHPYTKVLRWSTADLDVNESVEEPPLRGIDIPDPINPPSGCRFHTRCPKAREVCTQQSPALTDDMNTNQDHDAACFRDYDESHEYWRSDSITEDDQSEAAFDRDIDNKL